MASEHLHREYQPDFEINVETSPQLAASELEYNRNLHLYNRAKELIEGRISRKYGTGRLGFLMKIIFANAYAGEILTRRNTRKSKDPE